MGRVLVIGVGLVGTAFAEHLRGAGHHVVGTTTTPAKVEKLQAIVDEVAVLRGGDADAVAAAAAGADAIVVTAGPDAMQSMTPEQRAQNYRDVLVGTAESVVAAATTTAPAARVVCLSSLSVYGDAADHLDVVDETAPTTASTDPSPFNFLAMERTYRDALGDRATILRCSDIYGSYDPPVQDKIAMAHEHLGGSIPFAADALFYRAEVRDVARVVAHAIEHELGGTFNVTHPDLPLTNKALFDGVSATIGRSGLTYRGEIKAPSTPISVERLLATGFTFTHTEVAAVPA